MQELTGAERPAGKGKTDRKKASADAFTGVLRMLCCIFLLSYFIRDWRNSETARISLAVVRQQPPMRRAPALYQDSR